MHERLARDRRRAELRETLRTKHENARQQAVGRQEKYWVRRDKADRDARRVHVASEQARAGPVCFLPALPEAAQLSKATWARDRMREKTPDRSESIRAVEGLSDVWVGTYVNAWKGPTVEKVRARQA